MDDLTRARDIRFNAAIAAMMGLLADHVDMEEMKKNGETCPQCVARLAVEQGDELIKALRETKQK